VDHRAVRQQVAVVVAAVDTREDAVDASPDVNGIVHSLSAVSDASSVWRLGPSATPAVLGPHVVHVDPGVEGLLHAPVSIV
jgi:hypothetical protein